MCIFLGQKKYSIWGDFCGKTLTMLHDLTVVHAFTHCPTYIGYIQILLAYTYLSVYLRYIHCTFTSKFYRYVLIYCRNFVYSASEPHPYIPLKYVRINTWDFSKLIHFTYLRLSYYSVWHKATLCFFLCVFCVVHAF